MNNENAEVTDTSSKRVHDAAPSQMYADFMRTGWIETDYAEIEPLEVVTYAYMRRQVLSAAFPGVRLVLPSGNA